MVPPQTTELTADFSGDRISGSGGCNRFTGGFKTQGQQLSIGPLASTFMACEESVMTQETRYLTALQGAQRYEIDDQKQLTIVYQTEKTSGVLRFMAQAASEQTSTGQTSTEQTSTGQTSTGQTSTEQTIRGLW
jgi:heat shock protein HslJ